MNTMWREITSAPKDERLILKRNTKTKEIIIGKLTYGEIGEEEYWQSDCGGPIYPTPTHWMPLPELPKKKHACKAHFAGLEITQVGGDLCMNIDDKTIVVRYCPICGEKADE